VQLAARSNVPRAKVLGWEGAEEVDTRRHRRILHVVPRAQRHDAATQARDEDSLHLLPRCKIKAKARQQLGDANKREVIRGDEARLVKAPRAHVARAADRARRRVAHHKVDRRVSVGRRRKKLRDGRVEQPHADARDDAEKVLERVVQGAKRAERRDAPAGRRRKGARRRPAGNDHANRHRRRLRQRLKDACDGRLVAARSGRHVDGRRRHTPLALKHNGRRRAHGRQPGGGAVGSRRRVARAGHADSVGLSAARARQRHAGAGPRGLATIPTGGASGGGDPPRPATGGGGDRRRDRGGRGQAGEPHTTGGGRHGPNGRGAGRGRGGQRGGGHRRR